MILLISRPNYAIALISEFSIITDVTPVAIMTVYCLITIKAGKFFHFPHDSQGGSVIITGSRVGIITIAAEAGYVIGVPELNELLSVRSSSKKVGYFSAYPNANRNLISHLPNKDENWHHPWFLVKKSPPSIRNIPDFLPTKWTTKPAFIAPTLPTAEFGEFFNIVIEGETLWNSFTLDRFIEANHKLRMSPPVHLLQLPLPPPLPKGTSARAIAARRKTMSKSIVEACEVNKSFLQSTVDKKEYSRTLLVDDGSTEGARSAVAYRPTPHREGHSSRSSHKERSPRRDSPRPTS
ncbi:hypothetical protein AtNW77_Chr00c002g0321301 [Arabidopsis thaliana]